MKDIRNLKESQELELKSEWSDECLRSLCAFANTDGGKLMLGIDDEGKILGIKNSKKMLEDIPNKINNHLGIIPKVTLNSSDGKEIISIEIPSASSQVSYKSKFYVRSGSTNQELNNRQIIAVKYLKGKNSISNKEYQVICDGISRITATRDLKELLEKRIVKKSGTGKRDLKYKLLMQ